jgi:hypothetical protein
MITVYLYDDGGLYTHAYDAQEDPMGLGTHLVPIQSTTIAPKPIKGHWAVFKDGLWTNVIDMRGSIWDTRTGVEFQHTELGHMPIEFTSVPKPDGQYTWDLYKWVADRSKVQINGTEFIAEIVTQFGDVLAFNALTHKYPMLLFSITTLNWQNTAILLKDAHDTAALTDIQYEGVKKAILKFAVPVTLL